LKSTTLLDQHSTFTNFEVKDLHFLAIILQISQLLIPQVKELLSKFPSENSTGIYYKLKRYTKSFTSLSAVNYRPSPRHGVKRCISTCIDVEAAMNMTIYIVT